LYINPYYSLGQPHTSKGDFGMSPRNAVFSLVVTVLALLITVAPRVGVCELLVSSATDDDATLTLSIEDVIVRGTTGDLGTVRFQVTDEQVSFTSGDYAEIHVYEDDTISSDLLWSTSITFTSPEISAGHVDRTIGFSFDTLGISDPGDNIEVYAVAEVYKDACGPFCTNDMPETGILIVTLLWECTEPLDCNDNDECTNDDCVDNQCQYSAVNCDDSNECTDDSCDSLSGCANICNATGPGDLCCDNPACQGNPVCAAGSCVGSALASTHKSSLVYGSSGVAKKLGFLLPPMVAVIGLFIWRRKK
jgi:hypothetical protein